MSDRDLDPERIARAAAGDADELEHLLRAIEPELRAAVHVPPIWRRSLEAGDVLQVSFLEAFLRLASLQDTSPAGFRAWMRRLVQNNLTDAIRALERDKFLGYTFGAVHFRKNGHRYLGAQPSRKAVLPRLGHPRRARGAPAALAAAWEARACPRVNPVGEPDAGDPHVRFDERGRETEPRQAGLRRRPEGTVRATGSLKPPRPSSTLPRWPALRMG